MVLYQGKATLEAHDVPLTREQKLLGATSQIAAVPASTMSSPTTTAIFADSFFTGIELVRYLRDQNCRYMQGQRDNRIRNPPSSPSGRWRKRLYLVLLMTMLPVMMGYWLSDGGDHRTVTLLSTDKGVELMSPVISYCSETKMKEPVNCPAVIRSYNANMGYIDKSDMLVHLYCTT